VSAPENEPKPQHKGKILKVLGIGTDIAYQPFPLGNGNVVCRVEDPKSHFRGNLFNPHAVFFKPIGDSFIINDDAPVFGKPGIPFEDPFGAWITDEKGERQLLFGAVFPDLHAPGGLEIITKLYVAPGIEDLEPDQPIAEVRGMRDVRFAQMDSGKIAFFTRPDTKNKGWIGFTTLDGIEEIKDKERFKQAQERANDTNNLLKFRIGHDMEIGEHTRLGANSAYEVEVTLPDGQKKKLIRIFCHTSDVDPDEKGVRDFETGVIHYKGYDGYFDPEHPKQIIPLREIVRASDFPKQPDNSKGERYDDVVFISGTDGEQIYVGVRDRCAGVVPDPGFDPAYLPFS